jgi:hypothetical protein
LGVIDPACPQSVDRVLIGDEFSHGFLSHASGDPDDRFDDELVGRICGMGTMSGSHRTLCGAVQIGTVRPRLSRRPVSIVHDAHVSILL